MTITTAPGSAGWADTATAPTADTTARRAGLTLAGSVAAAASVAAGLVHAAAAGSHNGDRTLAVLFALTAVAQLGVGALGALHPRRSSYAAVAAVNLAAAVAWIVTRTSGTSLVASLEERQPIELPDATAAAMAALAVVAAIAAFSLPRLRAVAPVWAAVVGVVALAASVPAMAAPHDHTEHAHDETVAAGDGHDHTSGAAASGASSTPAAATSDPNLVLGVQLPDVPGVTQEQKLRAAKLINDTRAALAKYPTTAAAEAAGFVSIGDAFTGFEHFVNREYLANANTLDPNQPESLVFKVAKDGTGTKTLGSAMYILPPGKTMADVPDVAGAMTQWHDHQNLCWDPSGTRLAGVLVNGVCRPGGTFRPTPPMLHVWITEEPCGPFAGIEGSAHTGACNPASHSH